MTLPKALILLGFLFLFFGFYLVTQRYSPKTLEFKNLEVKNSIQADVRPVRIAIPSLGIEVPIYPSSINNGKWESTTKGVSYLSSSPVPGETGNSILYGHNFSTLLGSLPKIKPGEKIEITLSSGEKKVFTVRYTSIVDPTQTHILNQTEDSRITIYTCTGFLDSKRFVATALAN
ncbi:MAG: sortase [Candidatus Levybacteria bacterium]|nr:sortase [Candidatus Levybacteria bacterium]